MDRLRGRYLNQLILHYWRQDLDFDYLDVGAHCGITAFARAIFIRRCNRDNRVIAFEPGRPYELLRRGVSLNRLADLITPIEAAVTDTSGPVAFHILHDRTPGSSLLPEAADASARTTHATVMGVAIDDFARESGLARNLICKIDVEGADFKVIDGLAETIKAGCVSMQIEFSPKLVDSYANSVERLAKLTQEFLLFDVKHNGSCVPIGSDHIALSAFVELVRESQPPYTDILLLPHKLPGLKELVGRIIRRPDHPMIAFVRNCITRLGEPPRLVLDLGDP